MCIKCKGNNGPPVVLIRKDLPSLCKYGLISSKFAFMCLIWTYLSYSLLYFRTCFLASCVHKFRSGFGKANIVKDGESVALGFSGGASSLAMLFLAKMVPFLFFLLILYLPNHSYF